MYQFVILHSLEAATVIWIVVATEALIYSAQEMRDVWRGWMYNREYGNGRRAISRRRVKSAVGFVIGFGIAELAGFIAGGILVVGLLGFLKLPAPDYRVSTAIVRLFLVVMIFAFRTAMKNQRAVRRDLEALEGQHLEDIESIVEDTHDKVVEMHEQAGIDRESLAKSEEEKSAHRDASDIKRDEDLDISRRLDKDSEDRREQ